MTYADWAQEKKFTEGGAQLERDPVAYFEAVDLPDKLERALGETVG